MEQPKVLSGVTACMSLSDAAAATDFYKAAFAAEEVARVPAQDGKRLLHVHLHINHASVILSDAFPEHGHPLRDPAAFVLHLAVDDAQPWWDRALKAGATVAMPLQIMFWGDNYGQLRDPFGVTWSIGAPVNKA
jgi:uncharacterized glyoxalase superfamily protein PhnB